MSKLMRNNMGFTLIEVLIALAILGIALTAIVKATSQNIKDTIYLQNKALGTIVANDIVNQARASLIKLPEGPGELEQETALGGRQWTWKGFAIPTPNPAIKKIRVEVYDATNQVAQLESFVYAK